MQANQIIVGGYTDGSGGVCPMLAAHRNGGRTSFASFARAWDRYTRAPRKPRRATEREVRTLTTMLEASIADRRRAGRRACCGEAIADHRQAQADRARREEHAPVALDLTALARRLARLDRHAEQDLEEHREPARS